MAVKFANVTTGELYPLETFGFRFTSVSEDYTVTEYNFVGVDASGGAVTITLPSPSKVTGIPICVIKTDSSANAVTVTGTIAGGDVSLSNQYDTALLISNGTTFYKIN